MATDQTRWTHLWGANEALDRVLCDRLGLHYCEPGSPCPVGRRAYHAAALFRIEGDRRKIYCPTCGWTGEDAATLRPSEPSPL